LSFDDVVDVISGIIDGVPGIGNLISAGIDVSHALSYGVRFFYAKNDDEKLEMATLGVVTLGAAALPVAGNALPIMARQGVKSVLRKTPEEILLIGKKLGIYKQTVLLLSKTKWKYNIILVLAKIFGYEMIESLTKVVKYVRDLMLKINNSDIKRALKSLLELLDDILSDVNSINTAIKISKNLK
jgi:sulfur relay (sulfurtransferase) DsrC/TusE family protein